MRFIRRWAFGFIIGVILLTLVLHGWAGMLLADSAHSGDIGSVRLWLQLGTDPNSVDEGETALTGAATEGNINIMRLLISHGANVNAEEEAFGYTPLLCATTRNVQTVSFLLNAGADVNARDYTGITSLMIASENAQTDVVLALIAHKANVNLTDDKGQTTLMKVASVDYETKPDKPIDTARVLVEHGANINIKDNQGQTALMLAQRFHHADIVALLQTIHQPLSRMASGSRPCAAHHSR